MNWPEVRLGDICEFSYGKSLPAPKRAAGKHRVFGSNGQVGFHNAAITTGPTIVIGRKGSFGETNYSDFSCWPIDTTYYIDNSSLIGNVDLRWLYHRISALGLTNLNRAAAVPGLNREDAYRLKFLLPPVNEQQRIAAVLDQVDTLREQRRKAITLLDELKRSVFIDMFGNTLDDWPELTVEDIAKDQKGSIRTGPFGSQLLHEEFVEEGVAVLGIDNAVDNEFRWSERRFITKEKYRKLSRYKVYPGDVLITIMGTCGRSAVVPGDIPEAINTKHLCCITLDQSRCLPDFLHDYFLTHPMARAYLSRTTKGAIMAGLNMGIIKRLPLRLPPLDLQRDYVSKVNAIREQKRAAQAHLAELDALFASLQWRAFRGELWETAPD